MDLVARVDLEGIALFKKAIFQKAAFSKKALASSKSLSK
jgi:hypothetical protein